MGRRLPPRKTYNFRRRLTGIKGGNLPPHAVGRILIVCSTHIQFVWMYNFNAGKEATPEAFSP